MGAPKSDVPSWDVQDKRVAPWWTWRQLGGLDSAADWGTGGAQSEEIHGLGGPSKNQAIPSYTKLRALHTHRRSRSRVWPAVDQIRWIR